MPAPPEGSDPAMVSATYVISIADRGFEPLPRISRIKGKNLVRFARQLKGSRDKGAEGGKRCFGPVDLNVLILCPFEFVESVASLSGVNSLPKFRSAPHL